MALSAMRTGRLGGTMKVPAILKQSTLRGISMRTRQLLVVTIVAAAAAVLFVPSGLAHQTLALNNPVRITNTGCTVGYPTVSSEFTTVVFGVYNLGTVAHRFYIGGPYWTHLIKPGQEETLITYFHPGGWKWACTSRHSTVGRGIFTIRS